ncbi:rho GDP-dissociation inhibitor 1-like [Iris pallida]|uniref:Rho GDP-dissociation inhibitor 1-like n=1 Tax=Iris pallida TaxID=29817 RepID=A0AAX6HAQ8_IRIPA|nr:rho GDP-dissociation inhibitor 1-like [Iris pallida]
MSPIWRILIAAVMRMAKKQMMNYTTYFIGHSKAFWIYSNDG